MAWKMIGRSALFLFAAGISLPVLAEVKASVPIAHTSRPASLLIRLAPGYAESDLDNIKREYGIRSIRALARKTHPNLPIARWRRLDFKSDAQRDHYWSRLQRDKRIDYVEPDYQISVSGLPNDPRLSDLWGLDNTGQTSLDGSLSGNPDADIDAPEAWDITAGEIPIVVAVIDTGVEYTHPDLAANMWVNTGEIPGNGIDDDNNGFIDDVYGYDFANVDGDPLDDNFHGTHVAGTIGAIANNGEGIVGVSWNAKIMAVKTMDASGVGWSSDIVSGIDYAVASGAKIINASLGAYSYSQAMYDSISAANDAGVLVVAAAGNDNNDNDLNQNYPSGYGLPNVIGVAATDRFDARASFSNYGQNSVDIGAPGAEILSTTLNGGYTWANGTSMATPHVAGAAAVLLGHDPSLDPAGLKALIENHADSIPSMAGITTSGARLNLWRALSCNGTSSLELTVRSPQNSFTSYWNEPNQIRVFVSNCGKNVLGATVQLTFENGDGSIALFDDGLHGDAFAGDGVYGNVWYPQTLGPVSATIAASDTTSGTVSTVRTGYVRQRFTYRHEIAPYSWIDASSGAAYQLSDDGSVTVPIGFNFSYFGTTKDTVTVSANGFLTFGSQGVAAAENARIPSPSLPNDVIAPLWDDLDPQLGGNVYTLTDGVAPNRRFTVSWVDVQHKGGSLPVSFEVTLMEATGEIVFAYASADFGDAAFNNGASASVGIESEDGLDGTPFVFDQPLIQPSTAQRFYPVIVAPEISYRVTMDLTPILSTTGSLIADFIDGDGVNNNQFKILEFNSEGDIVLNPNLVGDATGSLVPGPARVGDAQFLNEISQPMIFGKTLSFILKTAPAGNFQPFPDTLSLYVADAHGQPYATDDPLGVNELVSIEIDRAQPITQTYSSASATASIEAIGLPVADAGGPYNGYINEPVQFDGSASSDPDGSPLTYLWTFGDGTTATSVNPVHTFTAAGTYDVSLAVNDGMLTSEQSQTTVIVAPNHLPVAVAGADQVIYGERVVQLDGSGSYDVDGTIEAYAWSQLSGPSVTLANANGALASFTAPAVTQPTDLSFRLSVTDDYGDVTYDDIAVQLLPYNQDADSDGLPDGWEMDFFGTLTLDATADSDGDGLSNAQEYAEGTNPTSPEPAPTAVTTLTAVPGDQQATISWSPVLSAARYDLYWGTSPTVSKTDGTKVQGVTSPYVLTGLANNTTYYYFIVAVNNTGESPNSALGSTTPGLPPIANANGPYTGHIGDAVIFVSDGSYDPDGLPVSFAWDFGDGTTGQGAGPSHTYTSAGTYTVVLTVSDGYMSSTTQTIATIVSNYAPTADAGPDQTVSERHTVQLDGSASHDADGTIASYNWTQIGGPYYVTLIGADTATPTFMAPSVSANVTLQFQLTVTDDGGAQATDTVNVQVLDYDADSDGDGLADGWEYLYFGGLLQNASDDPDGDGFNNLREFTDGTSPIEPAPIPSTPQLSVVPGDGKTLLLWSNVPNALRYDIYWSTTPGIDKATANHIQDVHSPYFHTPQTNGLAYYYTIVAVNNAGESPVSPEQFSLPAERQWTQSTVPFVGQLATGANGDAMVAWLNTDTTGITSAVVSRYTREGGWEGPIPVETQTQNVTDVRVAMDGTGNAFATWRQTDGVRHNLYAARYTPGGGWGAATLLENYDGTYVSQGEVGDVSEPPTVVANPDGNAVVVWLQEEVRWASDGYGYINPTAYASYYTLGKGWSPRVRIGPFEIASDAKLSVGIDESGYAFATWRREHWDPGVTGYYDIYANRYTPGVGWNGFSVVGPNTGGATCWCGPDNPVLSVAADGTAAVGYDASVIKSYVPGVGWSLIVSPDTSTNVKDMLRLAAGNGGKIAASWTRAGRRTTDLLVRNYEPVAGWGVETSLYSDATKPTEATFYADGAGNPTLVWRNPMTATYIQTRQVNGSWTSTDIVSAYSLYSAMSYGGDLVTVWSGAQGYGSTQFQVPYQATVPPLAPIANAGPDQTVVGGTTVTLDGTGSSDPDGTIVSYVWTQLSGTAVTLNGANTAQATFTAPSVNKTATVVFELRTTDDSGLESTDQVAVTVTK